MTRIDVGRVLTEDRRPVTSTLAVVSLCLWGALSLALSFVVSSDVGVLVLLAGTFLTTLFLLGGDDAVGLAFMLFAMSAIQRAVFSLTGVGAALYLDDAVLVTMALMTVYRLFRSGRQARWLIVGGVLTVVAVGLGFARATGTDIGIYQARQVLVPAILVLFGSTLTRDELLRLKPIVVTFGVIAALYALLEQLDFRPLDPSTYGGFQSTGEMTTYGREFPGFYYYYYDGTNYFVRSGGFLLNPPSLGMYIAAALGWLWYGRDHAAPKLGAVFISVLLIAGTVVTMARGGFVILAVLLLQPWILRKAGKLGFLVVGGALAAVAFSQFVTAGNSAKHSDGALYGFTYSLTNPLGGGFGTAGNAVHTLTEEVGEAGESLTTVFLTACGWIALALVLALLYRGLARRGGIPGAALTAALVVAVFSETAAGLDAAAFIWVLGGAALGRMGMPHQTSGQAPTSAHESVRG
ncbi:hypothetical protein SAMN04487847_3016 [Microbacterium sp. cf332]|nr:hypothetical protein SAMN04487847_3016 [Microbacterium sp. cf332]